MKQYLYICTALTGAVIATSSWAQCVATQDCATLGYTQTSCSGGKGVKCPFGNKWFCAETQHIHSYSCPAGYSTGACTYGYTSTTSRRCSCGASAGTCYKCKSTPSSSSSSSSGSSSNSGSSQPTCTPTGTIETCSAVEYLDYSVHPWNYCYYTYETDSCGGKKQTSYRCVQFDSQSEAQSAHDRLCK